MPFSNIMNKLSCFLNPFNENWKSQISKPQFFKEIDFTKQIKKLINALSKEIEDNFTEFTRTINSFAATRPTHHRYPINHKNAKTKTKTKASTKVNPLVASFSQAQIDVPGVPIHTPATLRILLKWIECLEETLKSPRKKLLPRFQPFFMKGGNSVVFFRSTQMALMCNQIELLYRQYTEEMSPRKVVSSTLQLLNDYLEFHREQYGFLSDANYITNLSSNILSEIATDVII